MALVGIFVFLIYAGVPIVTIAGVIYFFFQRQKEKKQEKEKQKDYTQY